MDFLPGRMWSTIVLKQSTSPPGIKYRVLVKWIQEKINQSWNGYVEELLKRTQKASLSSERKLNSWQGKKQKLKRNKTLNTSKLCKIMDDAGIRTGRYKQNIKSLKLEIRHFLAIWGMMFWRSPSIYGGTRN